MSSKVKTEAQQRKLDLRSVKKKNLFKKKKDPTSNYAPVVSPGESLTDRATKQEVKKKLGEFSLQFSWQALTVCLWTVLTEKHLELLKLFDHNRDYGPCIGKLYYRIKTANSLWLLY